MEREKQLVSHTILYAIANFGSSIISFLMLPIYTRYFSPSDFGTWDVVTTTVTLLVPFITFELTAATYRWLIDDESAEKKEAIISTGFFQLLFQALLFNILAIVVFLFIHFSLKWEALLYINALILSSFIQQCARGLKRNVLFASLGITQTVIVALLNIIFIYVFELGIELFFYANIIGAVVIFMVGWIKMQFSQYIKLNFHSKKLLKNYLQYAIPIIPATASWWVMTMADRWMIAIFLGVEYNGIYAVAIKVPAILLMINHVFSLAWKDSAITTYNMEDRNEFYSKVFHHYFRLLATSVICLTLLAKPAIEIFIGEAYSEAWKYSGILLLATFFHALALFWSAGFHGAKQTKAIFTTTVVGAVGNIVLNVVLIPLFGLYGVALSSLVAFFITWGMRVRAAKKYFIVSIPYYKVILLTFLMIISVILPFWINESIMYLVILFSLMLFWWSNMLMFKMLFSLIK